MTQVKAHFFLFPFFFSLSPSFSFFYDAQLLQHRLLRGYPLFIKLLSHIYKKSAGYIYVDLFLGVNSILTEHPLHMERQYEFTASLLVKEEGFCEVTSVKPNAKLVGKHRTWSTKEIICLAMAETPSLSFKKRKSFLLKAYTSRLWSVLCLPIVFYFYHLKAMGLFDSPLISVTANQRLIFSISL